MNEALAAISDEVLRRELADLTDYQLVERTVAAAGTRQNTLALPTFEMAGGTFHPVISYADIDACRPHATTSLEGEDIVFRQSYRDRRPGAKVVYAALWPGRNAAAIYEISASISPEDQLSTMPVGEVAQGILGADRSLQRIDGDTPLYARQRTSDEYRGVDSGTGTEVAISLTNEMQTGFYFDPLSFPHKVGTRRSATISISGSALAHPLPKGYTRVEGNRVQTSNNGDQTVPVELPPLAVKYKAAIPDSTAIIRVEDDHHVAAVSKYQSAPEVVIDAHLATDDPKVHRQIAAQLGWNDVTWEFFTAHEDEIAQLGPRFDREQVVTALIQALEEARSNPAQPIEPRVVGARQVVQFLSDYLARYYWGPTQR